MAVRRSAKLSTPVSAGANVDRASIATLALSLRGRHLLALDLAGIALAGYVALAVRHDGLVRPELLLALIPVLVLLLSVRTLTNVAVGLYSRRWRFASIPDLERIVIAAVFGTLVCVVIFYATSAVPFVNWPEGLPRSFWVAELVVTTSVLGGVRFGIRAAGELGPRLSGGGSSASRATLFFGAGHVGVFMARSALRQPSSGVQPVGFLDDDHDLAGNLVGGLRVYGGLDALRGAVAATGAKRLVITMPDAPGSAIRRVLDAALALGLEVHTVPSVTELLDGSVDAYRLRRVRVEDLLRRPIATEHMPAVQEIIRDQCVMITGAGGSIGSELARQAFALGPRRLVLVDRAESPLYLVQRELEARRGNRPASVELSVKLANVASRALMERVIAAERPSVIFHAAAYKHVPMMEEHPSDAVHVNVGGTLTVLDAAAAAGVARFVFVSTDKAVRPTSVMGASKRIAEMLVAEAAERVGRPYVSVRFGNVLGSTGSVVPIFQQQLEDGEPITITHPEMTRFFMTIPEAAWLIMDASALGRTGDLFVLDMGEPVRIMDLARDLVRLAGRDPEMQQIEIVGLRPGEKLHEELFYAAEEVERTSCDKILRVRTHRPPATVRDDVRALLLEATGQHEAELRQRVLEYAWGFENLGIGAVSLGPQLPELIASMGRAEQADAAAVPVH